MWKHRKRGTCYEIISTATLQCEGDLDGVKVVIYGDIDTGKIWVRPKREFYDGRFEKIDDNRIPIVHT